MREGREEGERLGRGAWGLRRTNHRAGVICRWVCLYLVASHFPSPPPPPHTHTHTHARTLTPSPWQCADKPFRVEFNGRLWWYREAAIKLAGDAPAASSATRRPTTGDRITVTDDYRSHGDAGDGA